MIPLDPRINDLRGRRFGRLQIPTTAEPRIPGHHAEWPYLCDCGAKGWARGTRLTQGRQVSCGCYRADPAVRRAARMRTPAKRRREIARMGGRIRSARVAA